MRRTLLLFRLRLPVGRRRLRRPVLRSRARFSRGPVRWLSLRLRLWRWRPVWRLRLWLCLLDRRPVLRLTLWLCLRRRRPIRRAHWLLSLGLPRPIEGCRLVRRGCAIGRIRGACHDRGSSGRRSLGHDWSGQSSLRRPSDRDVWPWRRDRLGARYGRRRPDYLG
jgi:hypothetical protein